MEKISEKIYKITAGEYNSYIVKSERTALINTAPAEYADEFLSELDEITAVTDIDTAVFAHTSPDIAGCFGAVLSENPNISAAATIAGLKNLKQLVNCEIKEITAKNGGMIDLGGVTLEFIVTPNLPWPDSMTIYCPEEQAVFMPEPFRYEEGWEEYIGDEIDLKPLAPAIAAALPRLEGFELDKALPVHGEIAEGLSVYRMINAYADMAKPAENKAKTAAIIYASRYGYTRELAETAEQTLTAAGYEVNMMDAEDTYGADIRECLMNADILLFGTPTINASIPAGMWSALGAVDVSAVRKKPTAVFGSYAWSGEGTVILSRALGGLKLSMFEEKPFTVILKPSEEDLADFGAYIERFIKAADGGQR